MAVRALVLRTAGTNCDGETVHALKACGAEPDLIHIRKIFDAPETLSRYSVMVIPGGFSYGDDVSAGKILANELRFKLGDPIKKFVSVKKLVIGICNGFQVLVKTGFLPGFDLEGVSQTTTLTNNDSRRFQCEWVWMKKESSRAAWLSGLPLKFQLPIAHGEGKFVTRDSKTLSALEKNRQILFRYFPVNPNGSTRAIAGICNAEGNVIGMMPHPERYVNRYQHPAWTRNGLADQTPGLVFWKSVVAQARKVKAK